MLEGVVRFPQEFAARYRAKGYWEDRSLRDTFAEISARYSDRVAIIDRDREVTYAELDERATRLALNLLDEGLRPLDRVVVQLPNVVEFAYFYFALQKIGCIPIMALPTHRYREISQFVELSGAAACVVPDRARDFDYTKLIRRIRDAHTNLRLGIILGAAPKGFLSLTELIERKSVRSADGLKSITIDPEDPALFQLSGGTTGVPKLIPRVTVQENFGMAEGMLMFVRLDDAEDVKMETVGRPISPDDEVRLVDDDDNEVAPGEIGEFLARGPYTLRGYYGAPEYNARAFTTDGFYRSGDLMRQHPSGNYTVDGRKTDPINRGGEKISAEEIENLILAHPAVQNVACVGMPDPVLGERMCACVILRPGQALT